jgi:hypothetical protein
MVDGEWADVPTLVTDGSYFVANDQELRLPGCKDRAGNLDNSVSNQEHSSSPVLANDMSA